MTDSQTPYRIIISGGGTGGHVFPAIAIANAIRERLPEAEFLFVGALGRMEMEKVPEAGYAIEGLNISGLQRSLSLKNLAFPFKVIGSLMKSDRILKRFRPHIAIGVGGYASGPLCYMAARRRVPVLLQEQNSYPGITNKMLAKKAKRICVAYEGMERWFPKDRITLTGNPVRDAIVHMDISREEALSKMVMKSGLPTLLVIGGSLGARTINESLAGKIDQLMAGNIQVIWQTGKYYFDGLKHLDGQYDGRLKVVPFIREMEAAYRVADAIISRAGAIAVSELCLVGKPIILVPSPNVAEDHQTKNARALVEKGAALLVADVEAHEKLVPEVLALLADAEKMAALGSAIKALARPDAASQIADHAISLMQNYRNG